ncbi:epsin homolog lqf isoform X2 [Brevipalpus obovatus]|uniref:epsin homolog lqf isoform X2 n=2 Tax=Brevipalpus obovatus TaxID=246614 RepID=UPI003D9DCE8E
MDFNAMINVRGLQRNVKNVVKNYTEPQVKVREATCNDPWGPSSTLMSEIADLTYNVVAFSEIMQMIWKRLNDHGKNWRHVYKALVLLEYLIKTGSEKVAQQCRENIFAIQTLKDFQYIEDNKDQGMNVREKSKALVALLKDDEKLKIERIRALKAKERFAQSTSLVTNSSGVETIPKSSASYHESLAIGGASSPDGSVPLAQDLESARPQTKGEEELQLQLALAMSKEEAEQEDRLRKNDEIRFQLALNESQREKPIKKSAMDDLLSINVSSNSSSLRPNDPWETVAGDSRGVGALGALGALGGGGGSGGFVGSLPSRDLAPPSSSSSSLVGATAGAPVVIPPPPPVTSQSSQPLAFNDPWAPSPVNTSPLRSDPWNGHASGRSGSATNDPWQPSPPSGTPQNTDPWSSEQNDDSNSSKNQDRENLTSSTSFDAAIASTTQSTRRTPESFLGPNSNLVNLDALVSTKTTGAGLPSGGNPFAVAPASNPFQAAKPPPPTINQLRSQNHFPLGNEVSSPGISPLILNQAQGPFVRAQLSSPTSSHNPFAM